MNSSTKLSVLTHDIDEHQKLFFAACKNGNLDEVKKALHPDWYMKTLAYGTEYALENKKKDYLAVVSAIFDYVLGLKKEAHNKLATDTKTHYEAHLAQETDFETNAYLSAIFSKPKNILPHKVALELLNKIKNEQLPLEFSLQSYFRQKINECDTQTLNNLISNPEYDPKSFITSFSVFSTLFRNINEANWELKTQTLDFLITSDLFRPFLKTFVEKDMENPNRYKIELYERLIQKTYQNIISYEEKHKLESVLPLESSSQKNIKKIAAGHKNKI